MRPTIYTGSLAPFNDGGGSHLEGFSEAELAALAAFLEGGNRFSQLTLAEKSQLKKRHPRSFEALQWLAAQEQSPAQALIAALEPDNKDVREQRQERDRILAIRQQLRDRGFVSDGDEARANLPKFATAWNNLTARSLMMQLPEADNLRDLAERYHSQRAQEKEALEVERANIETKLQGY